MAAVSTWDSTHMNGGPGRPRPTEARSERDESRLRLQIVLQYTLSLHPGTRPRVVARSVLSPLPRLIFISNPHYSHTKRITVQLKNLVLKILTGAIKLVVVSATKYSALTSASARSAHLPNAESKAACRHCGKMLKNVIDGGGTCTQTALEQHENYKCQAPAAVAARAAKAAATTA